MMVVVRWGDRPSTCASVVSAWGSQKVISMARYSSMAVASSASRLLPLAGLGVESAETQVAMGLKRAHADRLGQGEGLAVVIFSRLDLRGSALGRDVAEESQGIRLIAPLLLGSCDLEGLLAELHRLL